MTTPLMDLLIIIKCFCWKIHTFVSILFFMHRGTSCLKFVMICFSVYCFILKVSSRLVLFVFSVVCFLFFPRLFCCVLIFTCVSTSVLSLTVLTCVALPCLPLSVFSHCFTMVVSPQLPSSPPSVCKSLSVLFPILL